MPVIIVKTESDIKQIKPGSQYIIDVFPSPDNESQEFDPVENFAKRDDLQLKIEKNLSGELTIECPVLIPEGVRWHEPEKGEPITYAFRPDLRGADLEFMQDCWSEFMDWATEDTAIEFVEVPFGRANLKIGQREIDGAGKVVGEAVTRVITQQDRIVSGEIFLDSADSTARHPDRNGTHLHEGAHIIGIPHSEGRTGLMAAFVNAVKTFGEYEDTEKFKRYPRVKLS